VERTREVICHSKPIRIHAPRFPGTTERPNVATISAPEHGVAMRPGMLRPRQENDSQETEGELRPRPAAVYVSKGGGGLTGLLPVLAVALLWRFPSLFDPPWVNDEGTYFAVAQSMAHGARLYVDVWENKPPGIYLLYFAVYHLFGPSLLAVRLVTAAAVSGIVALVFALARHWDRSNLAGVAALIAGIVLGIPLFEGTTGNAEVFVAALTSFGIWLSFIRRQPSLAGIALALAILFKAVAAFDAVALALWLVVHQRRTVVAYVLSGGATLGIACAIAAIEGILPAMAQNAVFYDIGYVGHANGGTVPWLLLLKAAVLAVGTGVLLRRSFPALWLLWSVAGALVSGRLFGHYLLQAVPALSLCLVLCAQRVPRQRLRVALLALVVASLSIASAVGAIMVATSGDSILAERLLYYPNVARRSVGLESNTRHTAQIDDHVLRNVSVAGIVRALPSGKLLVWGNTPWIYVLSGRLPATPYTSARRQPAVPGETQSLRTAVERAQAREVVVITPPDPPLGPAAPALRARYRLVGSVGGARVYALRRRPAARAPSARVTAKVRSGTK